MKKSTIGTIVVGILAAFHMAGCGNSDGPTMSDDELLKRGSSGRASSASSQQTTRPEASTTGR